MALVARLVASGAAALCLAASYATCCFLQLVLTQSVTVEHWPVRRFRFQTRLWRAMSKLFHVLCNVLALVDMSVTRYVLPIIPITLSSLMEVPFWRFSWLFRFNFNRALFSWPGCRHEDIRAQFCVSFTGICFQIILSHFHAPLLPRAELTMVGAVDPNKWKHFSICAVSPLPISIATRTFSRCSMPHVAAAIAVAHGHFKVARLKEIL